MVPWHVVALQEPGSHLTSDALAVHIQISQHEDCGSSSTRTRSLVWKREECSWVRYMGTPIGLFVTFCAQAWFRRASSGKRTDVQAQERGHQHLPCGWQAIMGKCPFP